MKSFKKIAALSTLSAVFFTGAAFAQEHRDAQEHHDERHEPHPYVRHQEWRKGYHMKDEDWHRGERVDYRTYHLPPPRRGYEWREVDGNYVMAAVATGVIASVIAASAAH